MDSPLTREQAEEVWTILVEEAGASPDPRERASFVFAQLRGCREYRFGGQLGFGGKFWNNAGRWYVNCYPEDQTRLKRIAIKRANQRLAEAHTRHVR